MAAVPGICRSCSAERLRHTKRSTAVVARDGVVSMISPVGGLVAAATTYDDGHGPIDLTSITEAEAKQAIAAAQ
jgi:hypothetical protein